MPLFSPTSLLNLSVACTWVAISRFSVSPRTGIQPRGSDDEDKDAEEEDETDDEREGETKFWVEVETGPSAPLLGREV